MSIEERPPVVEKRFYYGDWEVDLVEGANRDGYLLTLRTQVRPFADAFRLALRRPMRLPQRSDRRTLAVHREDPQLDHGQRQGVQRLHEQ